MRSPGRQTGCRRGCAAQRRAPRAPRARVGAIGPRHRSAARARASMSGMTIVSRSMSHEPCGAEVTQQVAHALPGAPDHRGRGRTGCSARGAAHRARDIRPGVTAPRGASRGAREGRGSAAPRRDGSTPAPRQRARRGGHHGGSAGSRRARGTGAAKGAKLGRLQGDRRGGSLGAVEHRELAEEVTLPQRGDDRFLACRGLEHDLHGARCDRRTASRRGQAFVEDAPRRAESARVRTER